MKQITNHLGAVLLTLVSILCIIGIISLSAPSISGFFGETVEKQNSYALSLFNEPVADDPNPDHEPPQIGDKYEAEDHDYIYYYNGRLEGIDGFTAYPEMGGWSVMVKDYNKTSYGKIYTSIYGEPVVSMYATFSGCNEMTEAPAIPNGVTDISYAYYYCPIAEAPVIPDSVTNMEGAFSCCPITKAPVIPDGVANMESTFSNCTALTEAPVIPDGVTNMNYAFGGCPITEAPVIPDSVTNMEGAFSCCPITKAPVIPDGVANMESTFSNCTALTEAPVIPDSVTNMNYAFEGCTGLTAAPTIPDSVTSMGYAFQKCTSLTGTVTIPKNVTWMYGCFNKTEKQIEMKYYASCSVAKNCVVPANVTKTVIS